MQMKEKIQLKVGQLLVRWLSLAEHVVNGVSLNFLSPEFSDDPYPYYDRLRAATPVHYSIAARAWWVTGFEPVQEALLDRRFGADVRKYEEHLRKVLRNLDEEGRKVVENPSMINLDPPDHSRIRRLVSKSFLNKFVQSLEPRIREIVDECLARSKSKPVFDVVECLAKPLPGIVIAEMMGLPDSDRAQFQAWSEDLVVATGTNDGEKTKQARRSGRKLINYFRRIVSERRNNPGDDLIGQLILAEEEGDKLSEMELYNTCYLLLLAGHETTTRLIGNGTFLLLQTPGLWNQLREDLSRVPAAVEEMLRFEAPLQATKRYVIEEMEFHGQKLKKGDVVNLSIAAANRDPRWIENPNTFDISRGKTKHLTFGYGIHLCLGASLARLEAKVAFERMLEELPDLSLVDEQPHWGTNPFFRGHEKLEVNRERQFGK